MFGALKLGNLGILHVRKPYRLFHGFASSTSPAQVTAVRPKSFAGCRASRHGWATRIKVWSQISDFRNQGQNLCSYTSPSRNGEREEDMPRRTRTGSAAVPGKVDENGESGDTPRKNCGEEQPMDSLKLLTLPTILTIGRVAAIPLLVGAFYSDSWWGPTATTGIFIAAAVTDWLDGYLARKMKVGTQFGAFLDPVADKLIVATTLILLCTRPYEGGLFLHASFLLTVPAIAIIGREITMSAVREWAAAQDKKLLKAVAVNNLGKWKTATQMSALTILLAARDSSFVGAETLAPVGVVLLYVSAWLSLLSLFIYMRKIWRVIVL